MSRGLGDVYKRQLCNSAIAARIVLEAKRMLAHTGLPVGTIAQTLGFEETTHFSKFFKRVADLTLGEFRLKQTES